MRGEIRAAFYFWASVRGSFFIFQLLRCKMQTCRLFQQYSRLGNGADFQLGLAVKKALNKIEFYYFVCD